MKNSNASKVSQVLVISGMHRSGTSLCASILEKSGLNLGDNLMGPYQGNMRGHFEDMEIHTFHEKLLLSRNLTWLTPRAESGYSFSEQEKSEAAKLLRGISKTGMGVIGWKEPRASLFLSSWQEALNHNARFLLMYRHPLEVLMSLINRFESDVILNPKVAIECWTIYNRKIWEFYRMSPDNCLLVNHKTLIHQPGNLITLANAKLGLSLTSCNDDIQKLVNFSETFTTANPELAEQQMSEIYPDTMDIYRKLENEAGLEQQEYPPLPNSTATQHGAVEGLILSLKSVKHLDNDDRSELVSLILGHQFPGSIVPIWKLLRKKIHLENSQSHNNDSQETIDFLKGKISVLEQQRKELRKELKLHTQSSEGKLAELSQNNESLNCEQLVYKQRLEILKIQVADQKVSINNLTYKLENIPIAKRQSIFQVFFRKTRTLYRIVKDVIKS